MSSDSLVIVALAVAISAGVSILISRYGPRPSSREDSLAFDLAALKVTISTNERELQEQNTQIMALQRALGEAQLRINYLQEEVTFYKRTASEMDARLRELNKGGT